MNNAPIKVWCRNCKAKYDVSDLPPYTEFACPACGTILRTPERFGRYLLEKICGSGGTAEIYRAMDPVLARRVAVKIRTITPDENGNLEEFYLNEAKLFSKVVHPATVPIYDCGIIDNREFLVMQYMDGGNLEYHMKQRTLPDRKELTNIIARIAGALHYLHREHKIVHHDVKPSNILLDSESPAKIADFDLADRRQDGDTVTPCAEWGSPAYISPERLYSGGEDFRGDIFSLGVTFYELFTGIPPFGIAGDTAELLARRQNTPVALNEMLPDADQKISDLISRMLSYDPANRPDYPEIIKTLS